VPRSARLPARGILVTRALAQSHGTKAEAARALGIHCQHLYAKLREFGME
jgi:DNA-binding NtrC family response regulator